MSFLIQLVNLAFSIYGFMILARVVISWVGHVPYHPVVHFIYKTTEPILRPFRVLLPLGGMALDFSPLIAFFVLRLLQSIVVKLLLAIAGSAGAL